MGILAFFYPGRKYIEFLSVPPGPVPVVKPQRFPQLLPAELVERGVRVLPAAFVFNGHSEAGHPQSLRLDEYQDKIVSRDSSDPEPPYTPPGVITASIIGYR